MTDQSPIPATTLAGARLADEIEVLAGASLHPGEAPLWIVVHHEAGLVQTPAPGPVRLQGLVVHRQARTKTTLGAEANEVDGVAVLRRNLPRHQAVIARSEEHTSELQSRFDLVCR